MTSQTREAGSHPLICERKGKYPGENFENLSVFRIERYLVADSVPVGVVEQHGVGADLPDVLGDRDVRSGHLPGLLLPVLTVPGDELVDGIDVIAVGELRVVGDFLAVVVVHPLTAPGVEDPPGEASLGVEQDVLPVVEEVDEPGVDAVLEIGDGGEIGVIRPVPGQRHTNR